MMCFPLPKGVIKKISALCRLFLWTSGEEINRKSPVEWKNVCKKRNKGGLDMTDLHLWNMAIILRLLWNLSQKENSMWAKWVHAYHLNKQSLMEVNIKDRFSWIIKKILLQRNKVAQMQETWDNMQGKGKFSMKKTYDCMDGDDVQVHWKALMYKNDARPRAIMTLWLTCHKKLATKDRLKRFGMIAHDDYSMCDKNETINHLFYERVKMKEIWCKVLEWIHIMHEPKGWNEELEWLVGKCNKKSWKTELQKLAAT
ncbi:unnamed protein product [Vicia faba]|uniref:Reverse transcriptase zinc-binding domain-containing protein n=1 Tax=Vicia faba TaxID=3906 RepID=A0AAV1AAZ3_VICFA|nr:unnamed protein product [Vicia faba]